MKLYILGVILVIAGAIAANQVDVAAPQGEVEARLADLWLEHAIKAIIEFLLANGLDPFHIRDYSFERVYVERFLEVFVGIKAMSVIGLSDIELPYVRYSHLTGRLDFHIKMNQIEIEIDDIRISTVYGDSVGTGEASGRLTINNLSWRGNALIRTYSWGPEIYNIYVEFRVSEVLSDLRIISNTEDYSVRVNNFVHETLPSLFAEHSAVIDTVMGELMRQGVHWWINQNPWTSETN